MPDRLCPLTQAAQDAPRSIGLIHQGTCFSFAELEKETNRAVDELFQWGIRAGDRVAVFLPFSLRFYTLLFATLKLGALFCPLNLRLPQASLESHLTRLSPKLFATESSMTVRTSSPCDDLPPSSLLLFTSGSTGAPKLAVLTQANLIASATSAIACCDLNPGDGWLLSLPLHHVGGLSILFRCLQARASLIADPADSKVTHLSYVPAQLYRSWPVYPRLRCLLLGGGPIREIPSQLPMYVSYAMTETASLVLGRRNPPCKQGFWHLGFPVTGKEITLSPEQEILVRGDSLFQGYWDGEKLHRPFDLEGWFATKDLGRFDPQEGYAIIGRKDLQFISGGENIQPEEIEQELSHYPGLIDAVVVPVEDRQFGHRPVACVRMLDQTIDTESLHRFLLERLPKYKIPIAFFSMDEFGEIGLKIPRKQIFESLAKKYFK